METTKILESIWAILLELAPWLFVGAGIAGLLHVLLPKDFIKRHLGKPGLGSVIKAALIGVPMPLCSCSVIPTGLGLKKDGAGNGAALSFIISTPQTGVDSIAVTAAFLGWPFALFKVAAAFITGVVGGMLVEERGEGRKNSAPPVEDTVAETASCCASGSAEQPKQGIVASIGSALYFAVWELLHSIWRWLLIGVVISAVIGVYLPDIMPSGESNIVLTMLIVLAISIPLYVCATASVPIAATLVASGFPMGAALVFLMAGPATNIATIGAVASVLGKRAVIIYLSTVIIASMGMGILYDMFLSVDGEMEALNHHHHGGDGIFPQVCAVVLLLICAMFAWKDIKRCLAQKPVKSCCATNPQEAEQETGAQSCCAPKVEREVVASCCTPKPEEDTAASCCTPKPQEETVASCCGGGGDADENADLVVAEKKSCCGGKKDEPTANEDKLSCH